MSRYPQINGGSVLISLPKADLRRDGLLDESEDSVKVDGSFYVDRIRRGVYLVKHSNIVYDEVGNDDDLTSRVEAFVEDVSEHVRDEPRPTL